MADKLAVNISSDGTHTVVLNKDAMRAIVALSITEGTGEEGFDELIQKISIEPSDDGMCAKYQSSHETTWGIVSCEICIDHDDLKKLFDRIVTTANVSDEDLEILRITCNDAAQPNRSIGRITLDVSDGGAANCAWILRNYLINPSP